LETEDEVIGISDEVYFASHPRQDCALEPVVEYVVKVDVAQKRGQCATLYGSLRWY
jgi:hypothetical protein